MTGRSSFKCNLCAIEESKLWSELDNSCSKLVELLSSLESAQLRSCKSIPFFLGECRCWANCELQNRLAANFEMLMQTHLGLSRKILMMQTHRNGKFRVRNQVSKIGRWNHRHENLFVACAVLNKLLLLPTSAEERLNTRNKCRCFRLVRKRDWIRVRTHMGQSNFLPFWGEVFVGLVLLNLLVQWFQRFVSVVGQGSGITGLVRCVEESCLGFVEVG